MPDKFTFAVYGCEGGSYPSIVIDTRRLDGNTKYNKRYNLITSSSGMEYKPLIVIQCGSRTSLDEGLDLARRVCAGLNKEPTSGE